MQLPLHSYAYEIKLKQAKAFNWKETVGLLAQLGVASFLDPLWEDTSLPTPSFYGDSGSQDSPTQTGRSLCLLFAHLEDLQAPSWWIKCQTSSNIKRAFDELADDWNVLLKTVRTPEVVEALVNFVTVF